MPRSRLHPWLTLAVLALGAAGCDRKPETPKTEATDPETPADGKAAEAEGACDAAHGKALEQEISAQCALAPLVLATNVPTAPWKPAPAAAPEGALQLDLDREGMVLGGFGPRVPIAELAERFAVAREQAAAMAGPGGGPQASGWVLTIAGHTPRADVAATLKVLADAGEPQGHLRLATTPAEPVPAPHDPKQLAALADRMLGVGPSEKAVQLARDIERLVPACPPVGEVFAAMAMASPDERCSMMARDISQALVRCGCAKEAELMTFVYALTVGMEPPDRLAAALPVTLDPTAAPRPGATWAEVVAGLDPAALAKLWVSPS